MKTDMLLLATASALLLAGCIPGKGEPRPPGRPDPAARAECEARAANMPGAGC